MSNATATYKNLEGLELKLFLDIDLKSENIQDFYYKGSLAQKYEEELNELKNIVLNHSYEEALSLDRKFLQNEIKLPNGNLPIASMGLWLIHQAIEDYLGNDSTINSQNDLLCLCYGIGKKELKKEILNRSDYHLKDVIAETMATSACGSCREAIIKTMKDLREEHGLIQGMAHSNTRLDKSG
ncbi:MAG: (2Fe-2S)-binding protein, partial [Bacteriovorax sp.]|nr:(2Fe-2S)-binding protein [Bacteriovorax sp.]